MRTYPMPDGTDPTEYLHGGPGSPDGSGPSPQPSDPAAPPPPHH